MVRTINIIDILSVIEKLFIFMVLYELRLVKIIGDKINRVAVVMCQ